MVTGKSILLFTALFLNGCAVLTREAGYTRPENARSGFDFSLVERTKLQSDYYITDSININSQESIKVSLSVANKATMVYSAGPILPVIPTFWMKGNESGVPKCEKLMIVCGINFNVGEKYLEPSTNYPGFFRLGEEGMKYLKKRSSKGKDVCLELTVELPDGKVLKPTEKLPQNGVYTFDIEVGEVERFKARVSQVELIEGIVLDVNLEGEFKSFDFTQIQLSSPN